MTKSVRSKKRMLAICHLQAKLAKREYLGARKDIMRLEKSRDQLLMLADQMLDTDGDIHSGMLAARMEFGHRLITLGRLQKTRIAQDQKTAAMLLSEAHLTRRKEGRAAAHFRQATKSYENRQQQGQPSRAKGKSGLREGTTA